MSRCRPSFRSSTECRGHFQCFERATPVASSQTLGWKWSETLQCSEAGHGAVNSTPFQGALSFLSLGKMMARWNQMIEPFCHHIQSHPFVQPRSTYVFRSQRVAWGSSLPCFFHQSLSTTYGIVPRVSLFNGFWIFFFTRSLLNPTSFCRLLQPFPARSQYDPADFGCMAS